MLPQQLKQLEQNIRSAEPQSQSIVYYNETWRSQLGGNEDLQFINQIFPSAISRENLFHLAHKAAQSQNIRDIHRLFMGVMIWGYGTTGYGPWRTAEMLSTANISNILVKTFNLILQGRIVDAYYHAVINRCGPPYFTKYFYFIGYGTGQKHYPLILDTRVWEALRDRIQIDTTLFVKKSTWWYPEGYRRYVDTMHKWADELKCEAHNIEYVLFELGGVK